MDITLHKMLETKRYYDRRSKEIAILLQDELKYFKHGDFKSFNVKNMTCNYADSPQYVRITDINSEVYHYPLDLLDYTDDQIRELDWYKKQLASDKAMSLTMNRFLLAGNKREIERLNSNNLELEKLISEATSNE